MTSSHFAKLTKDHLYTNTFGKHYVPAKQVAIREAGIVFRERHLNDKDELLNFAHYLDYSLLPIPFKLQALLQRHTHHSLLYIYILHAKKLKC